MSARESGLGITADSTIEIHAKEYADRFNVTIDAAYKALKEAANTLFERKFYYTKQVHDYPQLKIYMFKSRWVSRIAYADDFATLAITFAPDVVPLITRLEERFTYYQSHAMQSVIHTSELHIYW
jgi:plasmid replication initiation protein